MSTKGIEKPLLRRVLEKGRGLADYLGEMREKSELVVDLAYAALLLEDAELAQDVIALEREMNELKRELQLRAILARVPPHEAEAMLTIIQIAEFAEEISDGARHIAEFVARGAAIHPVIEKAFLRERATFVKIRVEKGSTVVGRAIGELNIPSTGFTLLAIKSAGAWRYAPKPELRIASGDTLLFLGPPEREEALKALIH